MRVTGTAPSDDSAQRSLSDGACASWALVGPDVVLRRVLYDTDAATRLMTSVASDMPTIDDITANTLAPESDEAALAAFTATVRQQRSSP